MRTLTLALPLLAAVSVAHAGSLDVPRISPQAMCQSAIGTAEKSMRLPQKLLGSIAMVESGRRDPTSGKVGPWPWTINVAGTGFFFESKSDVIAAVERHRAAGVHSIDVGCMQVNLVHHANAFTSLEHAFDPQINATYAAGFLSRLYQETGEWPKAAAAYHSRTPELASKYLQRVFSVWPLARQYGGASSIVLARPEPPRVDPYGIYTKEFTARLSQDLRDRATRNAMIREPTRAGARTIAKSRSYRSAENRQ